MTTIKRTPTLHKDLFVPNFVEGKYVPADDTSGKAIGTIPKGAIYLGTITTNETAWNGTAPKLLVGWSGDTDALATDIDTAVGSTGIKEAAKETAEAAGWIGPLSEDREIILTATEDSSTAGESHVIVLFYFPFSSEVYDS